MQILYVVPVSELECKLGVVIELAQSLGQESVEPIEVFLLSTAAHQHLDYLPGLYSLSFDIYLSLS